jgi:hypothetical protein
VKFEHFTTPFISPDAVKFHDDYLYKIQFKNFYITDDLRKIDVRRKRKPGLLNVLPLKNIDKKKFVDLNSSRVLSNEIHEKSSSLTFKLLLQVIPSCLLLLLDVLFCHLLEIIAKRSRINFMQAGFNRLNFTVKGSSFISDFLRDSLDGFNFNENVTIIASNESCLPHPKKFKILDILQIFWYIFLQFYLIYNQAYIHRMKIIVCSIFYPEREALRIRFLISRILRRHKNFEIEIERRLKEKIEIDGRIEQRRNLFQVRLI